MPSLFAWGYNTNGTLGLGNIVSRSSPVQVGALTNWSKVAINNGSSLDATRAIKTDGTLWACGEGLGIGAGDIIDRSSPIQIGVLTTWAEVSISHAIKTDGTLWAWGSNGYGRLGLGNTVHRSSPVQVGALTTWSKVSTGLITAFTYDSHAISIKTNNSLWAWGDNYYGQLGLNNAGFGTSRLSPVQVGALTNWSQISAGGGHSMAIKTDGTMWAWGKNYNGQLGLGNIVSRSSPVQVGGLTTWSKVSAGVNSTMAIKTDGTMWAWGKNYYGQLGLGNNVDRSSPVQIGALTTWSKFDNSGDHFLAIKTNGTLWACGRNYNGQLGLGNAGFGTQRSSPVQVGALTNWSGVSVGPGISFAFGPAGGAILTDSFTDTSHLFDTIEGETLRVISDTFSLTDDIFGVVDATTVARYLSTATSSNTFNRVNEDGSLSSTATATKYRAIKFCVDLTGDYLIRTTYNGWDGFLSLYNDPFIVSTPLVNWLESDGGSPGIISRLLTAGSCYYAVISGETNNDIGTFTLEIVGPQSVRFAGELTERGVGRGVGRGVLRGVK